MAMLPEVRMSYQPGSQNNQVRKMKRIQPKLGLTKMAKNLAFRYWLKKSVDNSRYPPA